MTITAIREKLHHYIDVAGDKKIEAIFTVMENDIVESLDLWEDDDFVNEMTRRIEDFEKNDIQCLTWDEVKEKARLQKK